MIGPFFLLDCLAPHTPPIADPIIKLRIYKAPFWVWVSELLVSFLFFLRRNTNLLPLAMMKNIKATPFLMAPLVEIGFNRRSILFPPPPFKKPRLFSLNTYPPLSPRGAARMLFSAFIREKGNTYSSPAQPFPTQSFPPPSTPGREM